METKGYYAMSFYNTTDTMQTEKKAKALFPIQVMPTPRAISQSCGLALRFEGEDEAAYLEFAPEGYTVNAFRYILKRDLDCQLPRCLDAILHEQDHRTPKTLTIRQKRTETELPYDSIYYLESDLRKINVYGDVAHQPLCSYYGKLNELPQTLFENGFLRVGRSAVVNMKYIRQISSYMVTLRNGVKLGVSRNGYAEIRSTYLEWKGQFGDD